MNDSPRLLKLMSGSDIKLSKSDQKLVQIIRSDPQAAIHQSIASLAKKAEVSEPTVNRFCHKLGCAGYPDFKLRLAQEISSSGQLFVENMNRSDNSDTVMNKILSSIQTSVQSIAQSTNPLAIERSAKLIEKCKSVYFFGMGASGPVALDAQNKFFRFGMPVVAHTDFINQRMMSSMLGNGDVAIFISYTGRTKAMVENAAIASKTQASIIGITREGSPLASYCDHVLNAVTAEDTDLFTPMTSRIIHLAIVDILATTVALKLGDKVEANIKSVKSNLSETRFTPK